MVINDVIGRLKASKRREDRNSDHTDRHSGTLQAVRATLERDGHIYHRDTEARNIIGAICEGNQALADAEWRAILKSGYVVDVSKWVPEPHRGGKWYAWRDYVEGEIRFANFIVEYAHKGGNGTIVYGEPGTGKTHSVAESIIEWIKETKSTKPKPKLIVGSALNFSARNLENKIAELCQDKTILDEVKVRTVHASHSVTVDPSQYKSGQMLDVGLFVLDELGQLGTDAAGMAAERWHKNANVILSIGPGQLLPVGPGQIAEDLLKCLELNPMKGWTLDEKKDNFRLKTKDGTEEANGIVEFFRAVKDGNVEKYEKLGFKYENDRGLLLIPAKKSRTKSEQAGDWLGIREFVPAILELYNTSYYGPSVSGSTKFFCPLDRLGSEEIAARYKEIECEQKGQTVTLGVDKFLAGEEVVMTDPGKAELRIGACKGTPLIVVEMLEEKNKIRVQDDIKREFVVDRDQIRRSRAITGHSAQGLETDIGVVALLWSRVTTRRWLYTAVSRCRKVCIVHYQENGLNRTVANAPSRRTLFSVFFEKFRQERNI